MYLYGGVLRVGERDPKKDICGCGFVLGPKVELWANRKACSLTPVRALWRGRARHGS